MYVLTRMMTALLLMLPVTTLFAEPVIDLAQAEKMALENDPVLKVMGAQLDAFREQAVAEDTLPDPKLKLGLVNFPTDTYDRTQEPMTQILVGVTQVIPRGDTLSIKSKQSLKSADAALAKKQNRERALKMEVRSVYLELLYWLQSEQVVKKSKNLFSNLVQITQSQYSSGIQRQQDVIRAELERDMLDDRLNEIQTRQQAIRAQLEKLLYLPGQEPVISTEMPQLAPVVLPNDSLELLKAHPLIQQQDADVDNSQYAIEQARQEYKPDWMFEVNYGFRDGKNTNGSDRADFLSAMVSFDLPLFTGDRQDRKVAASRYRHQAALDAREDELRKLQSQYKETLATWSNLKERVARFESSIVPQARENAKASLYAYQNRRGEFTALMRARITELETELKYSRLQVDYLKAHARLLYLLGEQS